MPSSSIRTTLALPADLLQATDTLVSQGKINSRNEFIAQAIKHELAALKRAEIDQALAEMVQQPDYQEEVLKMDREFARASWEAFSLGENAQ
ncbi:MAG: CopG family transcriptional regulator [Snowella sp.]|nr:CopG family transcriptional regulator [Snowella sp.]